MREEEIVNKLINTYEKMCEKYTFDSLFRIRQDEMKLILGLIANLQQENQLLKKKYENAVADYEYEHYKNQKAIEYIINNFDFDNDIEKLFEILKGDKEWKIK